MVRSKRESRCVVGVVLAGLAFAGSVASARAQELAAPSRSGGLLLERTLAIVGGAIVTQSDVTLALSLGLLEGAAAATPETALAALVDRWLILHEVSRFAPAEPPAAVVEARLATVRARLGDAAAVSRQLTEAGRPLSFLAAWVRDDLRIATYLEQRFASAGAPAESDVAAYVRAHATEFEQAGLAGVEAASAARARLAQERRRDLIADWLVDLRRRTSVVTFPSGAP
ncbi:MAG: hypothetical protein KA371_18430 [Acidobacteria bacterium]|nr:hypothetical protein [Acidobacteriota bacterium]